VTEGYYNIVDSDSEVTNTANGQYPINICETALSLTGNPSRIYPIGHPGVPSPAIVVYNAFRNVRSKFAMPGRASLPGTIGGK